MKKEVIIRVDDNGNFKLSRFIRIFDSKNKKYKVLYKRNEYIKETKINEIRELTQVVEALNIKNKKERLLFICNKACDILDDNFSCQKMCKFKNNKCIYDRMKKEKYNGCCGTTDRKKYCKYLINNNCSTKCLACKFHVCHVLKKQGYKYKVNDILLLKYLLNWKQKIMIYFDFFMTPDEVVEDLCKNNIIAWSFRKSEEKFIYHNK